MIQKVTIDINIYNKSKILVYNLNLSFIPPAFSSEALQYKHYENCSIVFAISFNFDKFCMDEESWEKN